MAKDEISSRKRTIGGILQHLKGTDNNVSSIKEELTTLSVESDRNLKVQEDSILIISNFPNWTCDEIKEYVVRECGPEVKIKIIKSESSIDGTAILIFENSLHRNSAMERLRYKCIDGQKLELHSTDNFDSPSLIDSAELQMKRPSSNNSAEPQVKRLKSEDTTENTTEDTEEEKSEDDFNTYGLNIQFLKALNISLPIDKWVHVSNFRCDKSELKEVLELAGRVVVCWVKMTICRFAKVMYSHPLEAVQAVSMLNGQTYYGLKLNVSMDTQRGGTIMLPKGLSAIGPGLGINREPLLDVATHYKKFKSGKKSLLNVSLFSNSDTFPENFFNNNFKSINMLWGSDSVAYEKNNDQSSANVEKEANTLPIPSPSSLKKSGPEISPHPSISEPVSPGPPGVAPLKSDAPCNSGSSLCDIGKVSSELNSPDIVSPQTEAKEKAISDSDISSPAHPGTDLGPVGSGNSVSLSVKTSSSSPNNTAASINSPVSMGNIPPNHLSTEITALHDNIEKFGNMSGLSGFYPIRFSGNTVQPLRGQINNQIRPFGPNVQYCGTGPGLPGRLPINNRFNCPSATGPRPTGPMPSLRVTNPMSSGHLPFIGPRLPPVNMSRLPNPMPSGHMPINRMPCAQVAIGPRPTDPRNTGIQRLGNIFPNGTDHTQPSTVSLSNLPLTTTFTELSEKLSQAGRLISIQFTTPGCAIATFSSFEQATKCIKIYSGMLVNGNAIKVTYV